MKDNSYDYLVKLLIIGDSGVGKTNILLRACDNKADVFAWIEKNTAHLNAMRNAVPMMRNQLDKTIDEIKAEPT